MTAVVRSKEFWTPQRRLAAAQSPGRGKGRLPGGHIADCADLLKAIALCHDCFPKFNALGAGYVTKRNLPFVAGRCDGCQQFTPNGHLLVHHSLANNC